MPAIAMQHHISGEVDVQVTLDASSHVVSAAVVRSPSALLNAAAIAAAERSTFATRIVNCVPVGDTYLFAVIFQDASSPLGSAPAAMTAFFGGAWRCSTADGASFVRIFGLGPGAGSLIESAAIRNARGAFDLTEEIYDQHGAKLGFLQRTPVVVSGTSTGWSGNRLVFNTSTTSAAGTSVAGSLSYERITDDRFVRSFAATAGTGAPPNPAPEACERLPPSP